jgi:hypothetical protein
MQRSDFGNWSGDQTAMLEVRKIFGATSSRSFNCFARTEFEKFAD